MPPAGRMMSPCETRSRGRLSVLFDAADERAPGEAEIDWYLARLPDAPGTALQAMAGTGRLLLPLLDAGRRVHAVDASEAALECCRARLAAAPRELMLFRQDLPRLNLPFRYHAAFLADAAFQRLSDPVSALDALLRLRAHMVDPGILLLDLVVPEEALHPPGAPVVEARRVTLADGSQIALRSETSVETEALLLTTVARYEQRRGSRSLAREDETVTLTWYSEEAIVGLVEDAGYRDIRVEAPPAGGERGKRFAVSARV